jgi:hypothetical protein
MVYCDSHAEPSLLNAAFQLTQECLIAPPTSMLGLRAITGTGTNAISATSSEDIEKVLHIDRHGQA